MVRRFNAALLFAMLLSFGIEASGQTWVTAWSTNKTSLSTKEGGALLTVEETVDPSNLWDGGSNTFKSGGLTTASGSYQTLATSSDVTLSFTLASGHFFDQFWMVDTEGDASDLSSTLSTGTWTILESVPGSTGSANTSNGGTVLNHAGALIARANVGAVNSFQITFDDQTEDSTIGFAYSVVVPEPAIASLLGLAGLVGSARRRRRAGSGK